MKKSNQFRHESLQDADSINSLLKSIADAIVKGKISLQDEAGELVMMPNGLLHLKLTARQEEDVNRLDFRISWKNDRHIPVNKKLKVSSK